MTTGGYRSSVAEWSSDPQAIRATLPGAAITLANAEVPFALAGGMAAWARGGPETAHDIDFVVRPADAPLALAALAEAGLRSEPAPDDSWIFKSWDGDVLIDVIVHMIGVDIGTILEGAEIIEVLGVGMPVMTMEHVFITKLNAIDEQSLDLAGPLKLARAVHDQQVDWGSVRRATAGSAFAASFFTLVERLGIVPTPDSPAPAVT